MLSNPTPTLQQRHRQHRRQNSTPTAFEAVKVPNLPASALQRQGSHRRGLSLDHRSPQRERRQSPQDDRTVSNTQYQQHILREAQQQRLVRPGQHQYQQQMASSPGPRCGTPTQEQIDAFFNSNSGQNSHGLYRNMNGTMQISGNQQLGNTQEHLQQQPMPMPLSAGYMDNFGLGLDENEESHYFQPEHKVMIKTYSNDGVAENARRMSLQSDLNAQYQRPMTPVKQDNSAYFPLTPATTPFKKVAELVRTAQSSPARWQGDETIKAPQPASMQRGRSLQGVFGNGTAQSRNADLPSPPNTAPLVSSSTFDIATMPTQGTSDMATFQVNFSHHYNAYESSQPSPSSNVLSPGLSSFQSSPETAHMHFFDDPADDIPKMEAAPGITLLPTSQSAVNLSPVSSPIKAALSPRAMSISDLNLDAAIDASIEETGITIDDIAEFIEGPDSVDNKWVCRYTGCHKRFGRKENIKSHVQTHLGDRQFRCNHCNKCFVRGHDLKRHSKIHSGVKPYPCLCGNTFARHDALTRHRQRNMCIGAFDGIVKKVIKRGRPRKKRPEMDERQDKASRTRQRVNARTYASSTSGSSESSYQSPPAAIENLSIRGNSPFDDMPLFGQTDSYGFPPDMFTFTPPASPGYSTGNKPSPYRSHRCLTPTLESEIGSPSKGGLIGIPEEIPDLPLAASSPTPLGESSHRSPPELCLSSSSPAPTKLFDFESSSDADPFSSQITSNETTQAKDFGLPELTDNADDIFGDFDETGPLSSFETDSSGLMPVKKYVDPFFDDDFLNQCTQSPSDLDLFNEFD